MGNLLPNNDSLVVNSVIYRYTALKDSSSYFVVSVENDNPNGGYTFRSVDDWTGKPSGTINKLVALENIPLSHWGDGRIATEGEGTVEDPTVIYTYRYEPCKVNCVDFDIPEPPEIYDYADDEAVKNALEETDPDLYDRDGKKKPKESKADERLEKALRATEAANAVAEGVNQEAIMQAMSGLVMISTYSQRTIQGGTYGDTLVLPTKELPDNKRGLRNTLAQQLKHQQLVESQYDR